ncbi:MAG: fused response regulator/phosphatase [Planctomycetes bacterium]|nr:fused response regulator/phosphatase [Planctomycetota bacterium]
MSDMQSKLLVVDDNEMNRDMLSRRLSRRKYTVMTAENGQQALDMIEKGSFDVILLDIMMPGISGIEVLKILRESYSPTDLPIIMATAKSESSDIVEALKLGANDYVTKPLNFPVVLARVGTQLLLKKSQDALKLAHDRMKHDLEAAAEVQRSLLPEVLPNALGVNFAWHYEPCDELGGDILNVVDLNDGCIAMYLLDVSGHGVPAALLSVTLSRVLSARNATPSNPVGCDSTTDVVGNQKPQLIARQLNQQFPMSSNNGRYFTMAYAVLEVSTGLLRYVLAGHPPPILMRRGQSPQQLTGGGLPVGLFDDAEYEEYSIQLLPGDILYFYSDGITETRNQQGDMLDTEGLIRIIEESHGHPLKESLVTYIDNIRRWSTPLPFADDVSLLALELPA